MVGLGVTFGSPDYTTPHGGPPFQGWRKGFGFGHSKGAGGHVLDPSIPAQLRFTPHSDRGFASSAFWRKKYELGQASSFGIGDRPSYDDKRAADIAPNTYGDVSPLLNKVKRNATREGIKLKARFPSNEEKYRENSSATSGPGPAKYDTAYPPGVSSWTNPAKCPSPAFRPRIESNYDLVEQMGKPGPHYEVVTKPGTNCPIRRGTLYDVALKGRTKHHDIAGEMSPGPAKYQVKGQLESYTLLQKIENVKAPHYETFLSPRMGSSGKPSPKRNRVLGESQEAFKERTLTRVESSPV